MRKILALLLALLLSAPAYAEDSVSDHLKNSLGIDIETADAQTLKSVVEGIDESISPYSAAIELCLERLKSMGESKWVEKYREKYPDDLSGLSYDELVMLKDRINLAIWQSKEWQEVTVPDGVYKIGEDIPAGRWTISVTGRNYLWVRYGNTLSSNGAEVYATSIGLLYQKMISGPESIFTDEGESSSVSLVLEEGWYFQADGGSVVFTPYAGKPDLGFK